MLKVLFFLTAALALNNVPSSLLQNGRLVSFLCDNNYYMKAYYASGYWYMACAGQKNEIWAQLVVSVVSPGVYTFRAYNGLFVGLSYAHGYWFFAPTQSINTYSQFTISDSPYTTTTVLMDLYGQITGPGYYVGRGYYSGYDFVMPGTLTNTYNSRLEFTVQPWSQYKSMQIQWGTPVINVGTQSVLTGQTVQFTNSWGTIDTSSFQGTITDANEVTGSWNWEQATSLGISTGVTLGIPDVASSDFHVEYSVTTTIGTSGSTSNTSSWSYTYSQQVPPYTEIMAQTFVYASQINVPFTATVTYYNDASVDTLAGMYSGAGHTGQNTVITQFPLNCTPVDQGGYCNQQNLCCRLEFCCNPRNNICGNSPADCNPGA